VREAQIALHLQRNCTFGAALALPLSQNMARKFLDSLILEVPLIVLQYYKKPSFLYIYI
jgi:hypothetical protein